MAQEAREPILWFYRLTRLKLIVLYKIFFRFRHFGAENVPMDGRGIILTPNHASHLDPPLLGISLKKPVTYLAKEYLFKKPILGSLITWLGVLPIKSESDDFKSIRGLIRALKQGRCTVVFPEGTRTADGNFQKPEAGVGFLAIHSKAYVVPVYIKGSYEAWPRGKSFFRCHPIDVVFGKAFIPAEDKAIMESPDPYQATAERIMQDVKGLKENFKKV